MKSMTAPKALTMSIQTTITPHSQLPFVTRSYPSESQLDDIIKASATAQTVWKAVSVQERIEIASRFIVSQAELRRPF